MSLRDPVMHGPFVGNGVVGLHPVRVPKGIGYPVVEVLDHLVSLLSQVLEADTECLGRILGCVGFQELCLEVVPVVLVEPDDVVEGVVQDKAFSLRERVNSSQRR